MAGLLFERFVLISADGPAVEFSVGDWRITANRYGVIFGGKSPTISTQAELQSFARAMATAYKEYTSIRFEGKPLDRVEEPPTPAPECAT